MTLNYEQGASGLHRGATDGLNAGDEETFIPTDFLCDSSKSSYEDNELKQQSS